MVTTIVHPNVEERKAQGKAARQRAAPADHAGGRPRRIVLIPSRCSKSRTRRASPIWCRSGMGA